MRIHSFRAWMGTLPILARLILVAPMVLLALGCHKHHDSSKDLVSAYVPVITTYTATPSVLTKGESCTLYWVVTSAADPGGQVNIPTTLKIDQGIGVVPLAGSLTLKPTATITYTL